MVVPPPIRPKCPTVGLSKPPPIFVLWCRMIILSKVVLNIVELNLTSVIFSILVLYALSDNLSFDVTCSNLITSG